MTTTLAAGSYVDHFSVLRRIGSGGMADVWLARDTRLGRKVALKVIRADVLASAADRARFLEEARATARFSHPHIVTIYGVGEVDGRAYLALEYLEGATLRDRIGAAPREALRWTRAVASALGEAHAQGLVHRDLKPENVVLATDGRLRVLDFGLARPEGAGGGDGVLRGTPAYMAPELWLGDAPTAAVDVWALGVLLYELIAGACPFHAADPYALAELVTDPDAQPPRLEDDPPGVAGLVADCLERDPLRRPTARELVERIGTIVGGSTREASPFRGLSAFGEEHAALFFGRDAEIQAVLERLRASAFLAVVGPSGAGKSSFVQAGLLPRLRERGPVHAIVIRPGRTPLATLAAAVTSDVRTDVDELRAAPGLLAQRLATLARRETASVLLVVDQLEEVVALTTDPGERAAFIEAIVAAADDALTPVRVIVTLREEFLGRVATTEAARAAFSHIVVLRSPGPEALREIVCRPLEVVGHDYDDPTLPDDMVAEVVDEPAGLPLLQFAGQQLWLRRDRQARLLRRSDYTAIGGVAGALARHADGVLSAMSPAQVDHARAMLVRLVTDEGTRQILSRGEVLAGLPSAAGGVLDALIDARLLVARQADDPGQDAVAIELVHESLTRTWRRLARWIDESHDDIAFLTEVRQAAGVWARRGRPADEVWSDTGLAEALRRARKLDTVPIEVAEFLAAGRRRERQRRRRRQGIVAGVVLATIAVMGLLAWQRQAAVDQRAVARAEQARALRSEAVAAVEGGLGERARAGVRAALEISDDLETRGAWWRAQRLPMAWERDMGAKLDAVAWSPDGAQLAVGTQGVLTLIDVATGEVERVIADEPPFVSDHLVYSPDGARLLGSSRHPIYTVVDVNTGGITKLLRPGSDLSLELVEPGRHLTEARIDGKLVAVDAKTGERVGAFSHQRAGAFGGRGLVLVDAWADQLQAVDLDTGEVVFQAERPDPSCRPRGVHPTGLAFWCVDQNTLVVYGEDGAAARTIPYPRTVHGSVLSAAGDHLVTSHDDGLLEVRNLRTGEGRTWRTGHARGVRVALSGDGLVVWSGSDDGTLAEWDATSGEKNWSIKGHGSAIVEIAHRDGLLVTGDRGGTLRGWRTRLAPTAERGALGVVRAVAFSPLGDQIATGGRTPEVLLWDARSGRLLRRIEHGGGETWSIDISPDGRWMASSHDDHRVRIWDLRTGELHRALKVLARRVQFDPSSRRLAVVGDGEVPRIYRVRRGTLTRRLDPAPTGSIYGTAFSPDGRWFAASGRGRWAAVWDRRTGERVHEWSEFHDYGFWQVSFTADDQLFVDDQATGWLCDPVDGSCTERGAPEGSWWFGGDGRPWRFALADGALVRWDPQTHDTLTRPVGADLGPAPYGWSDRQGAQVVVNMGEPYFRLFDQDLAPLWTTRGVLDPGLRVWTHRGWTPSPPPGPAWPMGDPGQTRLVVQAEGGPACRWTHDDQVQLWTDGASPARAEPMPELRQLVPHPRGCVALTESATVRFLRVDGTTVDLAHDATSVAVAGAEVLVGRPGEVLAVDPVTGVTDSAPTTRAATAVGRCGARVCVGDDSGRVRVLGDVPVELADTPPHRASSVVEGPGGAVVVGFADGTVGAWEPATGRRLLAVQLHGPVEHLRVSGSTVLAVTAIGAEERLDLSAFDKPYCELLHEVWSTVSAVPGGGALERRTPPPRHACYRDWTGQIRPAGSDRSQARHGRTSGADPL